MYLIAAERSNWRQRNLRRKSELPAQHLARCVCKEQKCGNIAQPIEIFGIGALNSASAALDSGPVMETHLLLIQPRTRGFFDRQGLLMVTSCAMNYYLQDDKK
jgi:hypothetical protein